MLRDFKDSLFRGTNVDLAAAFVMGVAFAAVVSSLVESGDRSQPPVAAADEFRLGRGSVAGMNEGSGG